MLNWLKNRGKKGPVGAEEAPEAAPKKTPSKRKKGTDRGDPPIRILIGTCTGNRTDSEALARSLAERYFDIPDRSWFLLKRQAGLGYYYEIHEGGDGFGYLPDVIDQLMNHEKEIMLPSLSGRQMRVVMKNNGALIASLLSDRESVEQISQNVRRQAPMTLMGATGTEWLKVGAMMFSLGLLTFSAVTFIHKGVTLEAEGYYEFGEKFAPARLVDMVNDREPNTIDRSRDRPTPLEIWPEVVESASDPRHYITSIRYAGGDWSLNTTPRDITTPDEAQANASSEAETPDEPPRPVGEIPQEDPTPDPSLEMNPAEEIDARERPSDNDSNAPEEGMNNGQ